MKFGMVLDPLATLVAPKDTSVAILLAAQERGHSLYFLDSKDIWIKTGEVFGGLYPLRVLDNSTSWFMLGDRFESSLSFLDVLLIRKDPPFDQNYLILTQILQMAQAAGLFIVNKPEGLRFATEKLLPTWVAQYAPPTLVTSSAGAIQQFVAEVGQAVIKPLNQMGGRAVFILTPDDLNTAVIIETLLSQEACVLVQAFIPEVYEGDKRIFVINGKPFPFALVRIPKTGDFRGNMRVGASTIVKPLTQQDHLICEKLAPFLVKHGLWFVGLDIIGTYLTEINTTSPTGARELKEYCKEDPAKDLVLFIESYLSSKK